MQFTLDSANSNYQITSYKPGEFLINGTAYNNSVIISVASLMLWEPQSFVELQAKHLNSLVLEQPEVILLGTGEKHCFPTEILYEAISALKIPVEFMTTAAACRTFQVLIAEQRRVVAGLLVC